MSFSHESAGVSVSKGNGFYRLKGQSVNPLDSSISSIAPGDLIPIDTGFTAIAVGPDSDYENYELFYPDPIAPGGIQRIPFSRSRPFVGRVSVDNSQEYPNSGGEVSKAFVRVLDVTTDGNLVFASANIAECLTDLIVYTAEAPQVIPTNRVPKKRQGFLPLLSTPQNYYIPAFGRKLFQLQALRNVNVADTTITVDGIIATYPLADSNNLLILGKTSGQIVAVNLLAATPVPAAQAGLSFAYNAEDSSSQGYFDFYRIAISPASTEDPSDFATGLGFFLSVETRD